MTYWTDLLQSASPLATATTLLLVLFAVSSALDGLWIHLWRLRLHTRPESHAEHLLHTVRAILFVPILAFVFAAPSRGALWVGIAFVALDQLVELTDTWIERGSRASIGGLSSFEYTLHVALTTLRTGAIALAVVAHLQGAELGLLAGVAGLLLPGAALVAAVHVALALPRRCCVAS